MNDNVSFRDYLREYIDIKGVSTKKLSNVTNIPERYLEALLEGDSESLPPSPYILGYITKLSEELEFDKEEMWRLYKRDNNINGSGSLDRLPSNRYATKAVNKKILIVGAIGLLVFVYILWNFNKAMGTPPLEITYPTAENLIVRQPVISIEGKTGANAKLTINNNEVLVDEDGRFQKEITLSPGLNVFTINAKKLLGKLATTEKKIVYEPIEKKPPLTTEEQQTTIDKTEESKKTNHD